MTESGIRIEDYFRSINDNLSYINFSEYEKRGISYDDLKTLGVRDKITIGEDKVNGSHPLGEHSTYSVTWHTENSSFRWKLNLVDIIPVLKYIQKHPNETNSMIKSQAIFKTLQMNEEKLSGTLQLLKDKQLFRDEEQVSEIIFILRNKSESLLGTLWDGKWLYNSSNKLVSPQEISKHDLNESLYGRIDFDSKLYELLEFYWNDTDYREEKANEYDQLTDDQKESYFEIELQRRFGISISELDNVLSSGTVGGRSLELKEQDYEFPISKVKNWDTLKKHAAQSLFFADPVKYEIVQRSIRISKTSSRREYLLNMYRVNGNNMFACQICHKPFRSINDTQIEKTPTLELDQLNLCLCPNCARDFVPLRNNTNIINVFISKLAALSEGDIERNEYVEIPIADKKVWFTQTHAAEIAELLRLKNAIDKPHDLKAELKQFDHRLQVNVGFEEIDKGENRINDKSKSQTDASIIQNNVKKQIIETPIIDENNPESQRVKKTMKRLSVFDLNLVGKTVYLRSVLNYATVTKVNNEIIAFSVINKHGPNERIVYSRADCEKLDLVYKD